MVPFYKDFGVGKWGGCTKPSVWLMMRRASILFPSPISAMCDLDDLVGYGCTKKKLVDNTEAFVEASPANNCLLFGDAGTGKIHQCQGDFKPIL